MVVLPAIEAVAALLTTRFPVVCARLPAVSELLTESVPLDSVTVPESPAIPLPIVAKLTVYVKPPSEKVGRSRFTNRFRFCFELAKLTA